MECYNALTIKAPPNNYYNIWKHNHFIFFNILKILKKGNITYNNEAYIQ